MLNNKINNIFILILSILFLIISFIFDEKIYVFFKDNHITILDLVLSLITNFGVVLIIFLLIPSLMFYKNSKKLAYLLWLTFIVSIILNFIIKLIIQRQRPLEAFVYPFVNILNYSFPSMHSMVAFSFLPILLKCLPKQKYFWIGFAFLISFSRLYFSFHFLSDVVFGALAGYFIGKFLLELHENGKL